MTNTIYSDFSKHFFGETGRYWEDLGIDHTFCYILYKDYYDKYNSPAKQDDPAEEKTARREVILRYIGGYSHFSSKIVRHYVRNGMDALYGNMRDLIVASTSRSKIIAIYHNVHTWLMTSNLPDTESLVLSYMDWPTLDDIAIYLADVMYHVMLCDYRQHHADI